MVFSGSFLLTGPALAAVASNGISFASYWFYAAVALAVLNIVIGLVSASIGLLRLARPHDLDSGWLELDVEEFKRSSIWWANKDLDHNLGLVNAKIKGALVMAGVLAAELALLVIWGVLQIH